MRAAGVLLVCAGSLWWSLRACRRQRMLLRVLEDLTRAVEYLERELALGQRPLPELLEQLSQSGCPLAKTVFKQCREGLEQGMGFAQVWPRALEQTGLDGEESHTLETLGWLLGRYDARGQGESLARLHKRLEQAVEQRRRTTGQRVQVIRVLGVAAGCFLSLTLI